MSWSEIGLAIALIYIFWMHNRLRLIRSLMDEVIKEIESDPDFIKWMEEQEK